MLQALVSLTPECIHPMAIVIVRQDQEYKLPQACPIAVIGRQAAEQAL